MPGGVTQRSACFPPARQCGVQCATKKKKRHEKLVNVLVSVLLQEGPAKIDDFGKVVKHAVTGTSDNDGIAEESANFM